MILSNYSLCQEFKIVISGDYIRKINTSLKQTIIFYISQRGKEACINIYGIYLRTDQIINSYVLIRVMSRKVQFRFFTVMKRNCQTCFLFQKQVGISVSTYWKRKIQSIYSNICNSRKTPKLKHLLLFCENRIRVQQQVFSSIKLVAEIRTGKSSQNQASFDFRLT